jgi:hypothetical protein
VTDAAVQLHELVLEIDSLFGCVTLIGLTSVKYFSHHAGHQFSFLELHNFPDTPYSWSHIFCNDFAEVNDIAYISTGNVN